MIENLIKYRPVAIRFFDVVGGDEKISNDLFCTGIVRAAKKGEKVCIDSCRHECVGGSYFVCCKKISKTSLEEVYVNKEHVFSCNYDVNKFLDLAGQNPKSSKYVVIEPFSGDADVVLLFVNAANAGRILGLFSYNGEFGVDVVPAISTCASMFRPLIFPNKIHINFIDYFDRYYQGKGFFEDDELILSMTSEVFKKLEESCMKSSHGDAVTEKIEIFNVDKL